MPVYFLPPYTPVLYSETGVYRGINYFFLISAQKHILGYSLDHLAEAVLTSAHNICFEQEYEQILEFFI